MSAKLFHYGGLCLWTRLLKKWWFWSFPMIQKNRYPGITLGLGYPGEKTQQA